MLCIAAFSGLTLLLCALKIRVERALPTVLCLWMLLLTGLAMGGALAAIDGISIALLIALALLLAAALVRGQGAELGRRLLRCALTPGLAVFAVVAVFFAWSCENMGVWWGDDIFYWALEPKALWYWNGLTHAGRVIAPNFGTYTPGMAALQWQLMHIAGEWREGLLYAGLFGSYALFLLPLCERIDWKRAWLIPVAAAALIGLPTLAGALSYSFLSVDTALAACFAFALLTADDDQPLPLLAALTGLILLKQSGALLCLLVLLYTVMGGRPREALPARQKRMLCFLLPAATYIAWMIYCRAIGATGLHTGGTFAVLGQMLSGAWAAPEGLAELPSALWDALTHAPTTGKLLTALPILPVPQLAWLALLIVAPLLMSRAHGWKPMRRLSVFALVASALYLGTIALSFLTTFSGELGSYTGENVNNLRLLLERYLAPLLLGLGALELRCALDWRAMRGAGLGWAVSAAALTAAALCLCAGWPGMQGTLWPDGYAQREEVLPVEIKTAEPNDWYEDIEEPESAVILIGFSNDSEFIENLVYTFLPSRLVLATPGCADPAVLADVMRAEGVTHVICLDDACPLYAGATALSADESIDTYTLYVMNDEGQLEWT